MEFFSRSENKRFTTALLGLTGIVGLVAMAIYFRVVAISDLDIATFGEILMWQALSWSPWILVGAFAGLPVGGKLQNFIRSWNLPAHLVAAVAVASAATLWFKFISENLSPFHGLEGTRYGVFPWFFIFWFFFGLFLYWGCIHFFGLGKGQAAPVNGDKKKARLVVKTGKVSEVIKPRNVMWIEAQDYYSVLHLDEKQSWIKMTMKELEKTLDPGSFVRIHRSTIINVNHLKQIKNEGPGKYSAVMKDGKIRPISRSGWRDLKKVLKTTQ